MYGFVLCILTVGVLVEGKPTIGRYVIFLRSLLSAQQDLKYSNAIIFDRNQGEVNQEKYKRAFGSNGKILVEAYGKGFTKKQLQDLGYL